MGVGGPALDRGTGAAGPADHEDAAGGAGCAPAVAERSMSDTTAERLALHRIRRWKAVRVIVRCPFSSIGVRASIYSREVAHVKRRERRPPLSAWYRWSRDQSIRRQLFVPVMPGRTAAPAHSATMASDVSSEEADRMRSAPPPIGSSPGRLPLHVETRGSAPREQSDSCEIGGN